MKKIVLPTDFSENALHAIEYALRLCENVTCVFYLLHTYTPPIYRIDYTLGSPGQMGLPDDHKYSAESSLEKLIGQIRKKFDNPKHTFVSHASFNTLVDEMEDVVQKENIDFVVMGTQGATGAKEILFGSNTVHVMRNMEVPVLAIPSNFGFQLPRHLLFPTDFEVDYGRTDLDFLMWISKLWHSKIHVLHVSSPDGLTLEQENNKAKLEGLMLEHNHESHDLPDQELVSAINSFQETMHISMLAMVKNKHTFFERLFVEPVIKNIGLHSKIPFLVLPYRF
ncbi:universal stress protein [Flagellimonas taeanensis]|uniref:universal stress protein n=1 Tax=Flavobacteriaceae TaxID=49546 RepID=UPI000E69C586|nr:MULTISPECIES: universal stress protein [Allomuricauda]MDC6385843.1 universal stress protein [Muricauda sp. SK9]RIV50865.1 universal stress protein [Allomuricauda taeanensis]